MSLTSEVLQLVLQIVWDALGTGLIYLLLKHSAVI